jgi:hypothetical protein
MLAAAVVAGALPAAVPAQTSDLVKPRSSVEIVLDSSKAMGRARLGAARTAIVRAVHTLPAGTPVGLRLYGSSAPAKDHSAACSDSKSAVPVTPADSAAMRSAFKDVKPTGLAPVSLALSRAAKDLPANGTRTIVLVAGGADSCAPPPPCQTVTLGNAAPPVRVDGIGVEVDAAGRRALQCTARASGGVYRDAATPDALGPELDAALGRATRDRRSLGKPIAGGLEEQQGTPAAPGEYLDTIAPNTERWYHVSAPAGQVLSAAATLVAPPAGDVSAPGSSLTLDAFGAGAQAGTLAGSNATATASNLFAFDPSRTITVGVSAQPSQTGDSVRVALHDSPDKQLANKLAGRSLALELLFRLSPAHAARSAPPPAAAASANTHDVSWGAAIAALVVCALIAFAAAALVPRRLKTEERA